MRRVVAACAALCGVALVVSGCSSSGSSPSAGGSVGPSASTVASSPAPSVAASSPSASAAASLEKPPAGVAITQVLPKRPPHETAAFVFIGLAALDPYEAAFKAAMTTLGWSYHLYPYPATGSPATSVQQAIDSGAKFIEIGSIPAEAFKPQLAEAQKKGIDLVGWGNPREPLYTSDPHYYSTGDDRFIEGLGDTIAKWTIATATKPVNAVVLNFPDIPSLGLQAKAWNTTLASCSSCKTADLTMTSASLGDGSIPAKVTAYLQSHPNVNTIDDTAGDADPGLQAAVASIGRQNSVRIVDSNVTPSEVTEIAAGKEAAGLAVAVPYTQWIVADTMARLAEGQSPAPAADVAGTPCFVLAPSNINKYTAATKTLGYPWPGPAGYKQTFEKLWDLG
jgi:ribose transport system substrate-binding protein